MKSDRKHKGPKRHHFLSQGYLGGFCRDGFLSVYDRKANKTEGRTPYNTTVIKHFYSIERGDGSMDPVIEQDLAEIDGKIPQLVSDLREGVVLEDERRYDLAYFAALMMTRTPDFRDTIEKSESHLLKNMLQRLLRNPEEIKSLRESMPDASNESFDAFLDSVYRGEFGINIHRNRSLQLMMTLSPKFAYMLFGLNTLIAHAPTGSGFITCDRPLAIIPDLSSRIPKWGGVGILTPGAKKYLPLSDDLAVVFCDPGQDFKHLRFPRNFVRAINSAVSFQTERFLMGASADLVKRWAKRHDLGRTDPIESLRIN